MYKKEPLPQEKHINAFQNVGERIVLIDSDYKLAIRNLLA